MVKVAASFDSTYSLARRSHMAFYDSLRCRNYHDSLSQSVSHSNGEGERASERANQAIVCASATSNRDAVSNEWKQPDWRRRAGGGGGGSVAIEEQRMTGEGGSEGAREGV